MKLLLNSKITKILRRELRMAGDREIGGVLVGEHLSEQTFRIADISVQRGGGTGGHFIRDPAQHRDFLDEFFSHTRHDYERYNYIGEWHSHPNFTTLPSSADCATMYSMVEDSRVDTSFAILIIARLRPVYGLELSATAFRPGILPDTVELRREGCWFSTRFTQLRPRFILQI